MGTINIQLVPAQEYVRFLANACRQFCANQSDMDKAYNKMGNEWVDRIYVRTGEELKETAKNLFGIYYTVSETIQILHKRICALCRYNDISEPASIYLEQFTVKIIGGTMGNNELVNTTPEALEQFERALQKYMVATDQTIRAIINKHRAMASYWNDGQYNQFTKVISDFYNRVLVQLDKLDALSELVRRKRLQLIESENYRI